MAQKVEMKELIEDTTLSFARYVIVSRAIPKVTDGMKSIHRRIVYSMYESGNTHDKYRQKSIDIAGSILRYSPHGDCLSGDTVIYGADGNLYTMVELYDSKKEVDILAYDKDGNVVIAKVHSFRIGQYTDKIYKINLSNGKSVSVTGNHPFFSLDKKWIKAEELTNNVRLYSSVLNVNDRPKIKTEKSSQELIQVIAKRQLGGKDSDVAHHKNHKPQNNSLKNFEIMTKGDHAKYHKDYLIGLENGRKSMFSENGKHREKIKQKNSQLMKNYNKNQTYLKAFQVIDLILADGLIPTIELYEKYRKSFNKYPLYESMMKNNRIKNFEDLLEKYKNRDDYKISYKKVNEEVSQTITKKKSIPNKYFGIGSNNKNSFDVFDYLLDKDLELSLDNYENYRKEKIQKDGLGKNIQNRSILKFSNQEDFDETLELFKKVRVYVENIEIIETDNQPMYDFTVDGFENMLLPFKLDEETYSMISVHNSSAYDSMVRLTNDSVTYNPVDGKGAFGTITSRDDNGGAPRYTEARLSLFSSTELLYGLKKNAVDFVDNYNQTRKEPSDLPARIPMILANPNKGIAMGIATNIPSFDLKDIRDNVEALLSNKPMKPMYPTFRTGGYVLRDEEVAQSVQQEGRGSFKLRAKYHIEGDDIIVTEIPYGSKLEVIAEQIIKLRNQKDSEFIAITNINDDTNKDGLKFRIETKKGTDKGNLMKMLYAKTPLQANFPCNMYVLDKENRPHLWGTRQILLSWIRFRAEVLKRMAQFDIEKIEKDLVILYGLKKAIDELDEIIALIRKSSDEEVLDKLMKRGYEKVQAEYILSRNLRQLNKTAITNKIKAIKELEKELKQLNKFVGSKKMIANKIIEDIDDAIAKHYIERQTEIVDEFDSAINAEYVVQMTDYNVRVIITKDGYIKKIPLTSLRGNFKIKFKDGDEVLTDIETLNSEEVLVFTNLYNVYKKKMSGIQDTKPSDLGTFMRNEISMDKEEYIISIVPLSEEIKDILIGFRDGKVAKISTEAYRTKTNRQVLKNAFANKEVLFVKGISEDFDLMSVSSDTKTIIMNTSKVVSKASKTTQGVTFQKLKDDTVIDKYLLDLSDFSEEDIEYYTISNPGVGKYLK